MTGLAWDDLGGLLYVSTLAGLDSVDPTSCTGVTCPNTSVDNVFRRDSALTFEPSSGRVLREGDNGFGQLLYDVIDPATGTGEESIGLDPVTVGGLTVRELPEAGGTIGLVAGTMVLTLLRRRKRSDRA